jgi:hypothetical protein
MTMPGWLAKLMSLALAAVAVFFAIPQAFRDVTRGHHYLLIVPLAMWIIIPAVLLWGTWFSPPSWPPRAR